MLVVYFNQLLGAVRTRKLVETLFWGHFQPILEISKVFQWFFGCNQEKWLKNVWKYSFLKLLFKAGWHANVGWIPGGGYLEFILFWLIFTFFLDFCWKITKKTFEINKKVENGPEKVFQPTFRCTQHSKAGKNTQQMFIFYFWK